jgi:anthranilate phosphoribosyltransferase
MSLDLIFQKLLGQTHLTLKESDWIFSKIFSMQVSEEQARTVLVLLAQKGETSAELCGCLIALRRLEKPKTLNVENLIDTCGTGGDGASTINISSMAAIVAAAAGAKIAKHGNRAITSKSGSSDLMNAFGLKLDIPQSKMEACLKKTGFGYFHAPFYHPIFAKVQPLRKKIKVRTIFNLLGPLVNPFNLSGQVIGVSRKEHLELFADVLKTRKMKRAFICHSQDGLDEISTSAKTDLILIKGTKTYHQTLDPKQFGFKRARLSDYTGGDVKSNYRDAKQFFEGKLKGSKRDIALLNAAAAVYIAGLQPSLEKSLGVVENIVNKGAAMDKIKEVASFTKAVGK